MSDDVDVIGRRMGSKWWFKPMTLWAIAWCQENLARHATKRSKAYVVDGRVGDETFRAMLDAGMVLREENV